MRRSARRAMTFGGAGLCVAAAAGLHSGMPVRAADANPTALLSTSHAFPHGYMEYSLAGGQTVADTVNVKNAGPGDATFNLFAADGLTSQVTGVVYADAQHPFPDGASGNGEYGAGRWITLTTGSVHLAQGQATTVNLTVQVPAATAPGDYVGSVSAVNPAPVRNGGQFGFNVTTRTTIAVVVHVAGPVRTAGVNVGTPYVTVENRTRQILNIPLQYFGDVLVKPYVDLRVLDSRGRVLLQLNRRLDTFVPHTTLIFPFPLDAMVLDPGTYTLVIDFGPPGAEQHFQRSFTVTPANAAVPKPSQRGHTNSGLTPLLWLLGLLPLMGLLVLGLLVMRRSQTCAHCGRPWNGRRVRVDDVPRVRSCVRCRDGFSRRGRRVRLCPDCFAGHRGWRKTADDAVRLEALTR